MCCGKDFAKLEQFETEKLYDQHINVTTNFHLWVYGFFFMKTIIH